MRKRGFTIIEVVLVLAIAGLIFLMVFIALPALQRGQRNTRRRQDISRISTAFIQYMSQNNKIPFWGERAVTAGGDDVFVSRYIDSEVSATVDHPGGDRSYFAYTCTIDGGCDEFRDPDGSLYSFQYAGVTRNAIDTQADAVANFKDHKIFVNIKSRCGGTSTIEESNGANSFALSYMLEGGAIYCVDNS